jgi:mannose-6-phosphate isomerase-like protein (cupin superfamily)
MAQELEMFRRVITGYNAAGQSCIVEVGPPPVINTRASRPGYRNGTAWMTDAMPVPLSAPDIAAQNKTLNPPPNGSVVRFIDFPPEPKDPEALKAAFASSHGAFVDRDKRKPPTTSAHPGMHITDTLDYGIVISGEVYAVMEDGEVLLRQGDVIVQRGTNHSWSNRSDEVCRMVFVLLDAVRD